MLWLNLPTAIFVLRTAYSLDENREHSGCYILPLGRGKKVVRKYPPNTHDASPKLSSPFEDEETEAKTCLCYTT